MTFFKAAVSAAFSCLKDLGKRGISFPSRAYSQLVLPHQKDDGRLKDTMKQLFLANDAKRTFHISAERFVTKKHSDPCGGDPPGTDCHIDMNRLIMPCEQIKIPAWKGECNKICLPCCRPINIPVRCDRPILRVNLCAGVEYKYPSFAQTVEYIDCGIYKTDCCFPPSCKDMYKIGYLRRHAPIKDFQKTKLGIPDGSRRFFSTNTRLNGADSKRFLSSSCTLYADKKCDPQPPVVKTSLKKKLPCLLTSPDADKGKGPESKGPECLKVCTPCCKPAREPPTCAFPYQKPPCNRKRPPRRAFSECQADRVPAPVPCECQYIVLKRCAMGGDDDKDGKKCGKKNKK